MAGVVHAGADIWRIPPDAYAKYNEHFVQLKPLNGFLTGDQAKSLFLQSGLPPQILAHIWALADANADGKIDRHEFAVAMHLIQLKIKGVELPKTLPPALRALTPSVVPQTNAFGALPSGVGTPPIIPSTSVAAQGFARPASPVDMKLHRSGSVTSQDSPTNAPSASLTEWAIPQPSKLKYTQLFNSHDRMRSGYLLGQQARNILLQSGLSQQVLAQIWGLADIDTDGRLTSEEFVLAMHLVDCAKAGDPIPQTLPLDLIPPTFRRKRSGSVQSVGSGTSHNLLGDMGVSIDMKDEDKLKYLSTFEDKRRENFEKGQAELERRRLALLETQRKEQEERQRKEREEQERKDRIRQEQERRRQLELEKQLAKQRELEQEKEEQRQKALEQREAARREMERQRQLEWERQRQQELMAQRQREQEAVCHLKNRSKNLTFELDQVTNKINELNQQLLDTRKGVTDMKSSIDDMRSLRDLKMAELNGLKKEMKALNDKVLLLNQEKLSFSTQVISAAQGIPTADSYNAVMHSFNNKQITLHQLRNTLTNVKSETTQKLQDIENNNSQLKELKQQLLELVQENEKLYQTFEEKRLKILEMKKQKEGEDVKFQATQNGPEGDIWGSTDFENTTSDWAAFGGPDQPSAKLQDPKMVKYRVVFGFEARNPDELSIMPGDIILVPESHNVEPGWLGGELHGKTGWFPEAYVERIDSPPEGVATRGTPTGNNSAIGMGATETVHIVGTEMKRSLEGISEAPENGGEAASEEDIHYDVLHPSENSSFTQLKAAPIGTASPVPGQGQTAPDGLQAQALFPWRAKKDNHLTFNKGDIISVKEQQDMWWYGEFQSKVGWFPKSYVKLISGPMKITDSGQSDSALPEEPTAEAPASIGEECYVAMYAYQSQEPGDLSFQQGETVTVTKKEGDWWTGRINGRTGIFPSNYVQLAEPEVQQTTKALKKPEIVTVIAPYKATGSEQLTLEKGQLIQVRKKSPSGWWEGELQVKGKKRQLGWFPASYVKPLGGSGMSSGVSSNRSTPDPIKQLQVEATLNGGVASKPAKEQVVAIYGFSGQLEDELTFTKGQIITVLGKDDPAWWKGELNGTLGLFPSNYVEPLQSDVSTASGQ